MSRQFDITQPLSDEDREWLETNGRTDLLRENEYYLNQDDEEALAAHVEASTPDEGTSIVSPDAQNPAVVAQSADPVPTPDQAALAALTATPSATPTEPVAVGTEVPAAAEPVGTEASEDDEEADNYDDESVWSHADLKDEVKGRGVEGAPPLNSSRETFIAWLRADDATDEQPEQS